MGDRYAVPRHGVIPGVVIPVLAAETLRAGPVPRQWSAVYPLLLALIFVAASLGIRSRRLGSAFFVVSTLGVLTLPLATEALFSISLPLAPALAVLAAAALLSGAAFVAEQYLRRAPPHAATGLPRREARRDGKEMVSTLRTR